MLVGFDPLLVIVCLIWGFFHAIKCVCRSLLLLFFSFFLVNCGKGHSFFIDLLFFSVVRVPFLAFAHYCYYYIREKG